MRLTLIGLLVVPLASLLALWAFAASVTLGNALHERDYNRLIALSATPSDAQRGRVDDLDDPPGGPDGRAARSGPSDGGTG
jgi:hypothetical protein